MTASSFKVAINPLWPGQKLRPEAEGETRWGRHTGAWRTEEHTLDSFAQRVCQDGFAFCAVLKAPWRRESNFESLQVLATDHDGAALAELLEDDFIQDHAAFIYETPSSTLANPRSRAVFILDQPIKEPRRARLAYRALINHFANGAPDNEADRSCKDPTRFFYGRPNGHHVILRNVLYLDSLQDVVESYSSAAPGPFSGSETSSTQGETRQYGEGYNPHWGVPLSEAARQRLAQALEAAGFKRGGDRFNGPCILPHRNGPCDCPGAMYVSPITGAWHCFCGDHVGRPHGGPGALHIEGVQPAPTNDRSDEVLMPKAATPSDGSDFGTGGDPPLVPRSENGSAPAPQPPPEKLIMDRLKVFRYRKVLEDMAQRLLAMLGAQPGYSQRGAELKLALSSCCKHYKKRKCKVGGWFYSPFHCEERCCPRCAIEALEKFLQAHGGLLIGMTDPFVYDISFPAISLDPKVDAVTQVDEYLKKINTFLTHLRDNEGQKLGWRTVTHHVRAIRPEQSGDTISFQVGLLADWEEGAMSMLKGRCAVEGVTLGLPGEIKVAVVASRRGIRNALDKLVEYTPIFMRYDSLEGYYLLAEAMKHKKLLVGKGDYKAVTGSRVRKGEEDAESCCPVCGGDCDKQPGFLVPLSKVRVEWKQGVRRYLGDAAPPAAA